MHHGSLSDLEYLESLPDKRCRVLLDQGSYMQPGVLNLPQRGVLCPASECPPAQVTKHPYKALFFFFFHSHHPVIAGYPSVSHYQSTTIISWLLSSQTWSLLYSSNILFRHAKLARPGLRHHLVLCQRPSARRRPRPQLLNKPCTVQIRHSE